jgi:hypothetical protein
MNPQAPPQQVGWSKRSAAPPSNGGMRTDGCDPRQRSLFHRCLKRESNRRLQDKLLRRLISISSYFDTPIVPDDDARHKTD